MLCQNLTFSWRNLLEVPHFNPQDMESTKCEKERLAQKCHDLEMQLNLMKEEKSNLSGRFFRIFNASQIELSYSPLPHTKTLLLQSTWWQMLGGLGHS